eukprot:Skav202940  [mRNA]  locus=scaffold422:247756:249678:- [translate_table: standard]
MRGLGVTQKGANPMLPLSCVENPRCDPEYYCVLQTILALREFGTQETCNFLLAHLAVGAKHTQGPCHSFIASLHKLGWSWETDGCVRDHLRQVFHFMSISMRELADRIQQAWHQRILDELARLRPTMEGIEHADVLATRTSYLTFAHDEQAILRCALNGTQFTNDVLIHTGVVSTPLCAFCQQPDSQYHRHWECEFFHDIRNQFPELQEVSATLPKSAKVLGWIPSIPAKQAFLDELSAVPDTTGDFQFPPHSAEGLSVQHLFMDGGCTDPTDPDLRVATWGVSIYAASTFWPISQGGVPGWKQTALRGEIWGCVSSLKAVITIAAPCHLWIDNQLVFDAISAWHAARDFAYHKRKDADAWQVLHMQFHLARPYVQHVSKVASHCHPSEQSTPVDEWAVQGNQSADRAATTARQTLPASLWTAHANLRQQRQEQRRISRALHMMMVRVGQRALHSRTVIQEVQPAGVPETVSGLECDPGIVALAASSMDDLPSQYHCEDTMSVLQWVATLQDPQKPGLWVTFHQLLLLYQFHSQRVGPLPTAKRRGRTWGEGSYTDAYEHRVQTQGLGNYLTGLCRHLGTALTIQQKRAPSHVISFWSGSIVVRVGTQQLDHVDTHLREHASQFPARLVQDLRAVPPMFT